MKLTEGRILALFFLIAALSAFASAQASTISGRVIDKDGAGVPGALVAVEQLPAMYRTDVIADGTGAFILKGVQKGRYLVTATAKTFASAEMEVAVPTSTEVVLALGPRPVAVEVSVSSSMLAGTAESLNELPGSIDRLGPLELEHSRVFNFSEALRKLPGVNVRDEEGFGLRPNIGIRGTNPTRSTKVLLLEDGVPLAYAPYGDNASYYHPPIERYRSIEVLKGSSQILYGPQTIAGVINYLTPNPTEKPEFSVRATTGNRAFFDATATGSGTIGRTGIFAAYTRKQGEGAREFTRSELNDLSAKVVQTLNDSNALSFKMSYYGEDSNVTYSGLTEAEYRLDPRGNAFRNDRFYGDRWGFSGSHTGVLSPRMSLTTNAYANYFKRHWWRQSSNSGQRPNRLNVDPDCRSMADLNTTCGNEGRLREYETYGIEPRMIYNYDAGGSIRGELQAGVRLHLEHQDRRQENGDLPDSRTGVPVEINTRRNFAVSGFVQNRFVFGDLAITPGVRIERINVRRQNLLAVPPASGQTTVNAVIPGIGVAYSGIPRTTIFAGAHRGFSPPRAEDIIGNNGGVVELNAEKSWNYEVGVRTNPAPGVRLEGTFFRLDYANQIVPASLAGGIGATLTNGGETLQQGFEFSGQVDSGQLFRSAHNIYLRTAVTWLPTADFRGVRYSSVSPTVLITGKRLPYVPEMLTTASIGYAHPSGFDAFLEKVSVGRQFGDDLNTVDPVANGQRGAIPAQTYFNATANYTIESWRTTLFVTAKNIAGRTFIVDRSRGILPSMPRLVQVGLHVRF
jgi:Fe(3+) dicitrate transport protein